MPIFIGDTHGNFNNLKREFELIGRQGVNYCHVGDFGMIFSNTDDPEVRFERRVDSALLLIDEINVVLKKNKSHLYVIRGNHDNPEFWFNSEKYSRSNLTFCKDYSVYNIENENYLFIGGAVSIDRCMYYASGTLWWDKEGFVYDEDKIMEIMDKYDDIDVVVTHNCPEFCYPLGAGKIVRDYLSDDPHIVKDVLAERKSIGDVYRILNTKFNIRLWAYGHFHNEYTTYYNRTRFWIIPKNTFTENV